MSQLPELVWGNAPSYRTNFLARAVDLAPSDDPDIPGSWDIPDPQPESSLRPLLRPGILRPDTRGRRKWKARSALLHLFCFCTLDLLHPTLPCLSFTV
jgi:hypothetical protein